MTDTMGPGLRSSIDVNASPVIPHSKWASQASTWSWIWFVVALLIIIGFHIRIFGRAVPPAARFP